LFALSNGHIGLRSNLDEGEPYGMRGSYLNSVYEVRPLPDAEPAYGDPERCRRQASRSMRLPSPSPRDRGNRRLLSGGSAL
jgi:hypothetical protein